jgi:hypothetical protein
LYINPIGGTISNISSKLKPFRPDLRIHCHNKIVPSANRPPNRRITKPLIQSVVTFFEGVNYSSRSRRLVKVRLLWYSVKEVLPLLIFVSVHTNYIQRLSPKLHQIFVSVHIMGYDVGRAGGRVGNTAVELGRIGHGPSWTYLLYAHAHAPVNKNSFWQWMLVNAQNHCFLKHQLQKSKMKWWSMKYTLYCTIISSSYN